MLKPVLKSAISMIGSPSRLPGRSWASEMFYRVLKDLFAKGNDMPIESFRKLVAKPLSHRAIKQVSKVTQTVGGVSCLMVRPNKGGDANRVILFLHGGGYVVGAPMGHLSIISDLAVGSDCLVIAPDYRLAPEHPFPAPQQDCLAVAKAVCSAYSDKKIIIAGDSAGGSLALATEYSLQHEGLKSADALVLISPWVDPLADSGTIISNAGSDYLAKEFLDKSMNALMQGESLDNSQVNFTQVDLSILPQTLVQYGGGEIFADQVEAFCKRASEQGVNIEEQKFRAQFHDFQLLCGVLKDAKTAMQNINQFIAKPV